MLKKVVVFDSGFGGELFADYIEKELATVEVIRVIDWRHAEEILKDARSARRAALEALRPYIGHVDLIVFANQLLTLTSLKYFRRKFKHQKFSGFPFPDPIKKPTGPTLILATKAIHSTPQYYIQKYHLNTSVKDIFLDDWVALIDDGELDLETIKKTLQPFRAFKPTTVILGHAVFADIQKQIHSALGNNLIIEKGYKKAFKNLCHELGLRGGSGKK